MAMDLLDFLSKGLGGDFASRVSGLTGENSQGIRNALDAALPLLLAGAVRKASTPAGASELLSLINRHGTDPAQLASIGNLLSGGNLASLTTAGTNILTGLFGDRSGSLWTSLGNLAGIRPASATTLLTTLAPLVLGLLRGHAAREGLGASGLASLLQGQREILARRVPEGLAGSLGWGAPSTWFGPRVPVAPVVAQPPHWRRWMPWIVAALVATWMLTMLTRCGKDTTDTAPVAPAAAPAAADVASAPAMVKLYFDADSAAPAGNASAQLDEIIAFAKANPGATVQVAAGSDEVARNRALAIRNVLVGRGVDEERVDMKKPIESTVGSEERESRRVEVSVR